MSMLPSCSLRGVEWRRCSRKGQQHCAKAKNRTDKRSSSSENRSFKTLCTFSIEHSCLSAQATCVKGSRSASTLLKGFDKFNSWRSCLFGIWFDQSYLFLCILCSFWWSISDINLRSSRASGRYCFSRQNYSAKAFCKERIWPGAATQLINSKLFLTVNFYYKARIAWYAHLCTRFYWLYFVLLLGIIMCHTQARVIT